jgi:hypothetical protein
MIIDIFKVEHLPDMDYRSFLQTNKDPVDPYVQIRLGDKRVDNKKWKESKTANPVFGHRLSIEYNHPSCANDLVIEILDDDPGRDDSVATLRLPILALTPPVTGSPAPHAHFGPAWIPLYGDVRQLDQQVSSKLAK